MVNDADKDPVGNYKLTDRCERLIPRCLWK
jgi:hypothetical protein